MTLLYYLIAVGVSAVTVASGMIMYKKLPTKINIFLKTVSLTLMTALFFRYMWDDDNLQNILNLQVGYGFTSKFAVAMSLVQVWLAYAAEMLTILAPFFKAKTLPALVTFFCGFAYLLNIAVLPNQIMGIVGEAAFASANFRAILMSVETGLGIGFTVVYAVANRDKILLNL